MAARDTLRSPHAKKTTSIHHAAVPMDTFKWVVSGLLGTLVVLVGWFLSDIRADLRDVHKEVTAIRVEATATSVRLESLLDEGRRRPPR
jgi:hypothetical protein